MSVSVNPLDYNNLQFPKLWLGLCSRYRFNGERTLKVSCSEMGRLGLIYTGVRDADRRFVGILNGSWTTTRCKPMYSLPFIMTCKAPFVGSGDPQPGDVPLYEERCNGCHHFQSLCQIGCNSHTQS